MIEPLTKEDFGANIWRPLGRPPSELSIAITALLPSTGLKTPCHWKHTGKLGSCSGLTLAYLAARRNGFKVSARCKDGTLYAFRTA